VGKDALSERDKKFLEFADMFEDRFVRQGIDENRDIETTLSIGWELLLNSPKRNSQGSITNISRNIIQPIRRRNRNSMAIRTT